MTPSTLPILALSHPLLLLPASRITIPVSKDLAKALVTLVQESDSDPVVAAFPVIPNATNNAISGDNEITINQWGTAARIVRLVRPTLSNPSQPLLLSLHGVTRVRLAQPLKLTTQTLNTLPHHPIISSPPDGTPRHDTVDAFKSAALRLLDRLAQDSSKNGRKEAWIKFASMIEDISDQRAGWAADLLVANINGEFTDRLDFLAASDVEERLKRATKIFIKQASISEVSKKIASAVDESLSKQQKEFFLRQQLAAIQRELNSLGSENGPSASSNSGSDLDDDDAQNADDMADIKRKIEAMAPGSEERKMGVREWRRLKRIPQGSAEHGVIRSYLEWLTALPWPSPASAATQSANVLRDRSFLTNARQQLDSDHFGLEKVKRRLIEYLAVVRLRQLAAEAEFEKQKSQGARIQSNASPNSNDKDQNILPNPVPSRSPSQTTQTRNSVKGPILLFVGPPGTGKTSLGQSIARALDRPFQRISLGGVRDEAEIRGHRRTYVASGPGAIVQALRKAGRPDCVILLDEIDKVGSSSFHGDPSAALLEVLDPEQNHSFNDHYINVPIDLSQVLFICTSNTLDTIAAPLLDRCEVIQLSGYTYDEKIHIARRFLLPKQLKANGLSPNHIDLTDPALLHIATQYTREAGVRSLERAIGAVVRWKAVEWAECSDADADAEQALNKDIAKIVAKPAYDPVVKEADLEKILGIARWDGEERDREEKRGIVYGLVVMGQGEGGILPVETIAVPGSGSLKLTGSLGEVIKESGELALSWVKTNAYSMRITSSPAQDPLKVPHPIDIHLHLPAGAQKKDGPSAGIAMTCAFVSLLTGATVPSNIAMTGEITLRGRVTPVGGIKEKVLGAHRASITKVILPHANRKDVEQDVPREIRDKMQFVFVRTVEEALIAAFGKGTIEWRRDHLFVESRL
ncbi:ATP-dependent protease La [Rickenella mellea]|uniref:Lon protease homolog n=1 Tax=Rickenella mellea TaxID=50990 RepID=A0A4Y7QI14_9AGAM|nr:ATP-dependent protease La [Rickenella mellea]